MVEEGMLREIWRRRSNEKKKSRGKYEIYSAERKKRCNLQEFSYTTIKKKFPPLISYLNRRVLYVSIIDTGW